MSKKITPTPSKSENDFKKQRYERPAIRTESLTAVAAVCNGTVTGGRKATSPTCNAARLKS